METTVPEETSKTNKILRRIDRSAFGVLMIFLAVIVISSGMANIQTDAIDYYAIVQRLTGDSGNPIVRNLPFVDQRSPGYPILSLIPYSLISLGVDPFVQTEKITTPFKGQSSLAQDPTESMLLPDQPILFRNIFFKDFYIKTQESWFKWTIISSMLITSYGFLFAGLIFIIKALALDNKSIPGESMAAIVAITSSVFMHNIVNTPAYATLIAFGVSGLFGYFFLKGSLEKRAASRFLSGLFAGLLVLTRLETVTIAAVVLISLVIIRNFDFVKHYLLGASVCVVVLLVYNFSQFNNPLHAGILAGDINLIALDWGYIYANLFNQQSGILFWSSLGALGIAGLFLNDKQHTRILGIASLALIGVVLLRVPVMYSCVGEGTRLIGGLPITCPSNTDEMLKLIRFDANRYMAVLLPFSVIGLRNLVASLPALWQKIGQPLAYKK